ncbi:integrator complex subunit 5-like protein [Vigna unguiculata]|uniref:PolyADP-ribose polymerase n=1 Tax=Vigna unguiculata TaxID=3917 RepID=A0A4D6MBL7_VIGUN|nr:integrator complex subunit 5-like protein [Vigna unguiculata]QCD98799.1 PolyADP-ribose polymerase [Vigna unguiculata]
MALLTSLPEHSTTPKRHKRQPQQQQQQQQKQKQKQKQKPGSSWDQIKNLLTCKQVEGSRVHDPSKGYSKIGSSCSSICSFRDVVHGNTRVVHRSDNSSPESSSLGQETGLLTRKPVTGSTRSTPAKSNAGTTYTSSSSSSSSSSRGMQFRKLSGCYECHMIIDPSRLPVARSTVCSCSHCGEVFPKMESLELHQAVRHAVSELGPEDSGRNIVEIIFKSSWLKKDNPICKIERILKVHNTQRTIQRFEECRDTVKNRALGSTKKNPRCAADGNELLRFHCTTLTCALGARGSSSLCASVPGCGVCTIIRHGFQGGGGNDHAKGKGVRTTASSGRAHDSVVCGDGTRRAMLVCRVIAGRVKRVAEDTPPSEEEHVSVASYDSVAGYAGIYSNLEELVVFNPKAILPCFVVIYKVPSC